MQIHFVTNDWIVALDADDGHELWRSPAWRRRPVGQAFPGRRYWLLQYAKAGTSTQYAGLDTETGHQRRIHLPQGYYPLNAFGPGGTRDSLAVLATSRQNGDDVLGEQQFLVSLTDGAALPLGNFLSGSEDWSGGAVRVQAADHKRVIVLRGGSGKHGPLRILESVSWRGLARMTQ